MVYAPEVSQTSKENTMNTFCEHHKDSIRFQYACFDRILLNGVIQLLLPPERAGFFSHHRNIYPVTRKVLHNLSEQYHSWVENQARHWDAPILTNPQGRRERSDVALFQAGSTRPDRWHH